jgi:ubiquinone/menaquinone biosynthesis C-methylase UbiE
VDAFAFAIVYTGLMKKHLGHWLILLCIFGLLFSACGQGKIDELQGRVEKLEQDLSACENASPAFRAYQDYKMAVEPEQKFVVGSLQIGPGSVVGDIGCGYGHDTFWMARNVGTGGIVYAVDVSSNAITLIHKFMADPKLNPHKNVVPVLNMFNDATLPAKSLDAALLRDIHIHNAAELSTSNREMIQSLYRALKPGGRLLVIESFTPDPNRPGPSHPDSAYTTIDRVVKHYENTGFSTLLQDSNNGTTPLNALFSKPE